MQNVDEKRKNWAAQSRYCFFFFVFFRIYENYPVRTVVSVSVIPTQYERQFLLCNKMTVIGSSTLDMDTGLIIAISTKSSRYRIVRADYSYMKALD